MSVSKVECKAVIRGKGEVKFDVFKHLAPVTVSAILRELPINARVTIYPKAMICLLTGIKAGVEKQRFEFAKGDIAFLPANGSLCFFLANAKSQSPLNPIGKLEADLGVLSGLSAGDTMEIIQLREVSEGAQT
ncbi:MAG: cyclophilin-like family protein [Nitrososphaerales archaeon]